MESFSNPSAIWFLIGFAFFVLEFVLPGFIVFFFGLGAWIVGCITLFADVPLNAQIGIFLGTSVISVLLFRNWVRDKLGMGSKAGGTLPDEILGKKARAESAIRPGENGKVQFKGASWSARSTDEIAAGEEVIITGHESILLIVKSIQSL